MKYWYITKLWTQRNLAYPGRVIIWFFEGTVGFVIFPFIWLSIYETSGTIQGYNPSDIVTYYIVVTFISSSVLTYYSGEIRTEIMKGTLSTLLIKPLIYTLYASCKGLSYRLILVPIAVCAMGMVLFFFPEYFKLPESYLTGLLFLVAVTGAFIFSSCIEILIGLGAFWFGENNALRQAIALSLTIFSGQIAPLEFFPKIFQNIALYNPFQYLVYFPTQLYLSKLSPHDIITNFIGLLFWLCLCFLLIIIVWKNGLKRFDGAGI